MITVTFRKVTHVELNGDIDACYWTMHMSNGRIGEDLGMWCSLLDMKDEMTPDAIFDKISADLKHDGLWACLLDDGMLSFYGTLYPTPPDWTV
jgi:hypothetical protein